MQDIDIATQRYARLDDDVALTWEAVPGVLRYGLVVGLPDQSLPPLDAIMMGEAPGFALVGIPAEFSAAVERGSLGEEERQYGLVAYRRDGSIVVAPDLHFHAAGSAPADRAYFSFQLPLERSTVLSSPITSDDLAPAALADAAADDDATAQPATDTDPWGVLAAPSPDTAPLNAPPPDVVESLAEPSIDMSMAPLDVAESIASQDAAQAITSSEVSTEMEPPGVAADAGRLDAFPSTDAALTAEAPHAAVSDGPPGAFLVREAPGVIDAAGLTEPPRPVPLEAAPDVEPVAPAAPAAPVEDVVARAASVEAEDLVALAVPVEEAPTPGGAVVAATDADPIAVAVPVFWPTAAPPSAAVATLLDEAALYLLPRWADHAAATRLLERATALAPDDARVRALRDQLREAPDVAGDDAEALLREAGRCLERHDYWRAVSLYERVLARQPDHAAAQSAIEQARQVGQWSARMAGANGDAARLRRLGDGLAVLAPDLAAASYAASFAAFPEVETLRVWLRTLVRAEQPGAAAEARRGVEALWLSGAVAPDDAQDQALAALDEAERAGAGAPALDAAIDALMAAIMTEGGDG